MTRQLFFGGDGRRQVSITVHGDFVGVCTLYYYIHTL